MIVFAMFTYNTMMLCL